MRGPRNTRRTPKRRRTDDGAHAASAGAAGCARTCASAAAAARRARGCLRRGRRALRARVGERPRLTFAAYGRTNNNVVQLVGMLELAEAVGAALVLPPFALEFHLDRAPLRSAYCVVDGDAAPSTPGAPPTAEVAVSCVRARPLRAGRVPGRQAQRKASRGAAQAICELATRRRASSRCTPSCASPPPRAACTARLRGAAAARGARAQRAAVWRRRRRAPCRYWRCTSAGRRVRAPAASSRAAGCSASPPLARRWRGACSMATPHVRDGLAAGGCLAAARARTRRPEPRRRDAAALGPRRDAAPRRAPGVRRGGRTLPSACSSTSSRSPAPRAHSTTRVVVRPQRKVFAGGGAGVIQGT